MNLYSMAIVIVFVAAVASLAVGLVFLIKDNASQRRLLYMLYLRVGLCALLVIMIVYGLTTGLLHVSGPLHRLT